MNEKRYEVCLDNGLRWMTAGDAARFLGGVGMKSYAIGDSVLELPSGNVRQITDEEKRALDSAAIDWGDLQ